MLSKEDIQHVQTIITQNATQANFGVPQVPQHKHTGIDSLKVSYTDLLNIPPASSFAGSVASNGTAVFLPAGWSSAVNSGDVYTVTHNLNSTQYSLALTAFDAADPFVITWLNKSGNSFQVTIFNAGGSPAKDAFDFTLTLVI